MKLRRVYLDISDDLREKIDRLAAGIGCPRNTVMQALLDGAAGVASAELAEDRRQRRLPAIDVGRTAEKVITFDPCRVTIRIPRGGKRYRLARTLF